MRQAAGRSTIARQGTRAAAGALTLGAGLASAAGAQRGLLRGPGAEYAGAGASRLATGALDDRLAARGYPTFGRTALALSLGGYRLLRGGVALGAEWHGVVHGDEAHLGRTVAFGGGYGTVGVGYAVALSPRVRVYPRLGVGVGGLGLRIERPERPVAFDAVLAEPDRGHEGPGGADRPTVLSRTGPVVDVGAGAEVLFGGRAGGRGRRPLVGVRLGYLAAPSAPRWRLAERRVDDGPAATLAGPYVRVVVGAGRIR